MTDCPPSPQAQGTGLGQGLGFTWGCLSLELGLTWRQVHPGLRLSPGEGGGTLRSRFHSGSEWILGQRSAWGWSWKAAILTTVSPLLGLELGSGTLPPP